MTAPPSESGGPTPGAVPPPATFGSRTAGALAQAMHRLHWGRRQVPLVLQAEAAECGLACLAMVAGAHGLDTDLPTLRQRFLISQKGVTAADVAAMGAALGLAPRALRAEPSQLRQVNLPCILHWDLNHFVVLAALRGDTATVHDPARGVRRMSLAELSPHFSGVALEFSPTADFRPGRARQPLRWRALLGPVSGLKRALGQVLGLALALELFVLLSPYFLQWVVDEVLVSGDTEWLAMLAVGFSLLVGLQAATAAARSWAVLHLSATLNLQWVGNVFAHLLRLPQAWFERRHTGDIWSRFAAVHQIQDHLTHQFAESLIDGVMVLGTLALMALIHPPLAGVSLLAVAGYAVLRLALLRPMREASAEALVHEGRQSSHFLESLRAIDAIKLFNAEPLRLSRFLNLSVETTNARLQQRRMEVLLAVGQRLLFGLERVAVVWLGAQAVLGQQISTGVLFAFLAYKEQFLLRAAALVDKTGELRLLRLQAERLADIVLTAPEADDGPWQAPDAPISGREQGCRVTVQGLRFRYSDLEPEVLCGVDFDIAPGESVAITGPSGGGKSTLLKLLLGFHDPLAGEVRVDGVPLARLGRQRWRQQVGTVLQDEPLLAGSVADNIAFFAPDPDRARIEHCARLAAVHDEIAAMPMGYQTLVGDMGTVMSGGQKQRILLARALYKQPAVLVLDEATSALDVAREQAVNEAVRGLRLTRIIVAHRPETVASADRVIVLAGGRVVEDRRLTSSSGRC